MEVPTVARTRIRRNCDLRRKLMSAFIAPATVATLEYFLIWYCYWCETVAANSSSSAHTKANAATFLHRPFQYARSHKTPSSNQFGSKKGTITVTFPHNTSALSVQKFFMKRALQQARHAGIVDSEVPIGAVVVRNLTHASTIHDDSTIAFVQNSTVELTKLQHQQVYEILSEQHNSVEKRHDASAHAEMLALRDAAAAIQNWRLIDTTLYSTLEPCPMCCAAAQAFRVQHIVYGAPDIRLGACGTYCDLLSIARHPYHNISSVTSGICANESSILLRSFFRLRRQLPRPTKSTSVSTTMEGRRYRRWQFKPLLEALSKIISLVIRR
jgi:tRNA(adenine34) deaminase